MGEANNRGTAEERKARRERINGAVENRQHTDGLVWLIIQVAPSEMATDKAGAIVTDDNNKIVYVPNEQAWEDIMPEDVPDWVKEPNTINLLRNGECVSQDPEKGTKWYRGIRIKPPEQH